MSGKLIAVSVVVYAAGAASAILWLGLDGRAWAPAIVGLLTAAALGLWLARRRGVGRRTVRVAGDGGEVPEPAEGEELVEQVAPPARRMGAEMVAEHDRLVRLGRLLDSGLLVVDAGGRVHLATERAREMFRLEPGGWDAASAAILRILPDAPDAATEELLQVGSRVVRASVRPLEGRAGFFVELRDPEALAGVERDLRMANRVRNLIRLYRGLTHDVHAPLNAISLHLEILRRELAAGDDEEAPSPESLADRVDVIRGETDRLERTLAALLDQTAPGGEQAGPVDLGALVVRLSVLLESQGRRQSVEIVVERPERPVIVVARDDQLRQALLNVAINGLDAMPEGGALRLSVGVEGERGFVRIADSASGIPPQILEGLFDAFASTKERGVGVGLFIARSLLEAQGGEIELESTSEQGSVFVVRLPLADEEETVVRR